MTGPIIALCLFAISLGSFVIFVAGAMNAASNADDASDALEGDMRLADLLNHKGNE